MIYCNNKLLIFFFRKNLGEGCVIGAGSNIGLGATINRTVIGDHCTIHKNVICRNSFIQNNVTVNVSNFFPLTSIFFIMIT